MAQRNTLLAFLAVGGYALWKNRDQVGAFAQKIASKASTAGTGSTASPSSAPDTTGTASGF